MIPEVLATFASGVFAGAAVYVTLVEHPARLSCGIQVAVAQWRPSYKRGTLMQAPLAFVGALSAFISWWFDRRIGWLIGGALLLAVIPFTLVAILPTNKGLENQNLDVHSELASSLLSRWGRLHAVRSISGGVAFVMFLFVLSGG